ncbi:MAG: O-antigen ligase family protein [Phycisphaerales bacterium]|nr:MAG: O-antigen ligase family protein [Phycisphaerales bacterium]
MVYKTNRMDGHVWAYLWDWQVIPCTLAVVAGPLITMAYRLTRTPDAGEGSFSLAQALRGILCLMMFASLLRAGCLYLLEHPLIRPLTYLSVFAVLTSFLSPYPYENIVFAVRLAFAALVFANAFHLADRSFCDIRWPIACAWFVLILMSISQALGLIMGNTVAAYQSEYATAGVIDQAAITSAYIISTLPVFLMFFPNGSHAVLAVVLLLVSLFFTMRRTDLIAAVVTVLFIVIGNLKPWRRVRHGKMVCALCLLAIITLAGLRSAPGADLVSRFKDLDPSQGTGSGRYIIWRVALDHMAERPLGEQALGEGMGSIRDVIDRHFGSALGGHNDWLDITFSFGVVGLMALGWWYLTLARFTIALYRIRHPVLQGVFSSLVILFLMSAGSGGVFDPSFAMVYAALGFWAAMVPFRGPHEYAGCASY